MRTALAIALAVLFAGCHASKPDQSVATVGITFKSTGPRSKRATTRNDCYEDYAREVLVRTGGLRERHAQFARMDPEDLRWQEPIVTNEKLWIAFRYENAVKTDPEAKDSKPSLHVAPQAFLSPDAIALRMYFLTGEWKGETLQDPKLIGEMKVVYFIEVPDAAVRQKLSAEIDAILADEASRYDGRCGAMKKR
ncbi:MAG: hypothetical protein ACYC8T_04205 [Myxococcaceae bacterium]